MKRSFARLGVAAAVLIASNTSYALVLGGSNLGVLGYPAANCRAPMKPTPPFTPASRWEIDSYNMQVDTYNSELERFIACTKEYLENAQNDMKRIREGMDEAVERAKRGR